ncbi:MAG TPA: hypothetical protein VJ110_02250 [Candidatus Nanoarchaeia archaeon]|nr:hypothetical protein [Candidatus Nanoarchaeia archaeon]
MLPLTKRGDISFVAKVVIAVVFLALIAGFLFFFVFPFIQESPVPGFQAVPGVPNLSPGNYFTVDRLSGERGILKFYVVDPAGTGDTAEDDVYVTDFHPITGYSVSEDRAPTIVEDVSASQNLYIIIVADPEIETQREVNIIDQMRSNNINRFNKTFVSVISVTDPELIPDFVHRSIAGCVTCEAGAADLWAAIINATLATTSVPRSDKVAIFILSDGRQDAAADDEKITAASFGLSQTRAEVYVMANDISKCSEDGNPLTLISTTINAKREPSGCLAIENSADVISGVSDRAAQITLRYRPLKGADGEQHNVTVKVDKGQFRGSGSVLVVYPESSPQ